MKKLPLFLFVGVIITTVVLSLFFSIHRFFETQSQTIQSELLNDIANQLNQTVIEKTTNYLMPAEILAKSTSNLIKQNIIKLDNYNQIDTFLLSSIKSYSQIAKLYISDKDGNFSMVFKDKNKTLSSKQIQINKQLETIRKRNKYDQVISTKSKKDKYDAKTRPWFIGANQAEKLYWTDLYIFYTGKRPGITASYPIYGVNNNFKGIVGVDIELAKISEFLSLQKEIYNAKVIILDEKDQIVAQPDNISFTTLEDGSISPQTILDIQDDLVVKALSEHKESLLDRFEIKKELTSYFVSLASFPEYFGKKWRILIILPKAELINFSTNSSTLDLIYIIVLLLFSLLLTLIITFVIINPINAMIEDFDRLEKNNIQDKVPTSIISEISRLITVYIKLKHKSLTKPK